MSSRRLQHLVIHQLFAGALTALTGVVVTPNAHIVAVAVPICRPGGPLHTRPVVLAEQRVPTNAGGYLHTDESRAKISAANKGRTPWNMGKQHSEETRRRIAEGTRRAMQLRKEREREAMRLNDPARYAELLANETAAADRARLQAARREEQKLRKEARAKALAAAKLQERKPRAPRVPSGSGRGRVNYTLSEDVRARLITRDPYAHRTCEPVAFPSPQP